MPAPVPPGHTRGTIVVLGATTSSTQSGAEPQNQLLQRFWTEAGGYGSRIVICGTAGTVEQSNHYTTLLTAMEAETIEQIQVTDRSATGEPRYHSAIERATGILLVAPTPFHIAALLGGTPLATAVRRANARGKTVAGAGASAAILCQHMITTNHTDHARQSLLQRDLIQFAPGLGMVNRLLLTIEPLTQPSTHQHLAALLTAVATNPFLVGVDIQPDTGIVIYPDTTIEVFGANNVLIVDGNLISYTDTHSAKQNTPISVHGVQLHVLKHGQTYNFDTHQAHPQPASDIPEEGAPDHVTF